MSLLPDAETAEVKRQVRAWVQEVLDPLCAPMEEEERLPDALVED